MFTKIWMSLKASKLFKNVEPCRSENAPEMSSRRHVMRQLFVTLPAVLVAAKLSSGFNALGAPKSGKKPKTGSKPKTPKNPSPKTKTPKTKTGKHDHHHGRHCGKTGKPKSRH